MKCPITLVMGGNESPYIGGEWQRASLYWWPVEVSLTLMVSGPSLVPALLKMASLTLVVNKDPLNFVTSRKNTPVPDSSKDLTRC